MNKMLITLSTSWVVVFAATVVFGGEKKVDVAKVFKLAHLAVIVPDSEELRNAWECELWSPTVSQAAAAETAILRRLKDLAKTNMSLGGHKIDLKAQYVIQYLGVVLNKKKWIVCSVINVQTVVGAACSRGYSVDDLAALLETIFTSQYTADDSQFFFSAFYDPATDRLSESMGDLSEVHLEKPAESPERRRKVGNKRNATAPKEKAPKPKATGLKMTPSRTNAPDAGCGEEERELKRGRS